MKTHRVFRYLWRINAILILVATGGVCLLAGSLMLSEMGCSVRRKRAIDAAPPLVRNTQEHLYLGQMRLIDGKPILRGELLAPSQGLGLGSSGYKRETRNILYMDLGATEARWLLPDSNHVISEDATVWSEEQGAARHEIAGLVLVKSQSEDLQLDEGTLLIISPSGRQVTTVSEDVRTLNHASLVDQDKILVLYERRRRYIRAMIDAHTLKVISEQELSVPELQ